MSQLTDTIDGNMAACHVAYACSEQAFIFPITPSSPMAELADVWSTQKRANIFGNPLEVTQMQSEGGAAGAYHGAVAEGSLVTTFTASQGLLLMIPNMYKLAGEGHPFVMHVAARQVATHCTSIFGEHGDVMACRQTGFAMLSSHSVQEAMDLALVAHVSTLTSRIPFMHFFDGFQVSHEVQKVNTISYDDIKSIFPMDAVAQHRERGISPVHPTARAPLMMRDTYMQATEALEQVYRKVGDHVKEAMEKVAKITGRHYHLFDYYGAEDAENIIVVMGAASQCIKETIDALGKDKKWGLILVRLYRPWYAEEFLKTLPKSVKRIAVLDRTKEGGSFGEPLYLDVAATILDAELPIKVVGGRFGLGDKQFTPAMVVAVYNNLTAQTIKNHFTVGINDDVTHTSLTIPSDIPSTVPSGTHQCIFYGLGADGTVGANKMAIKLIGTNTPMYAQGYFFFNAMKAGGLTNSHLRFGPKPIESSYPIQTADFIACHQHMYLRQFPMLHQLQENGIFLLNSAHTDNIVSALPNSVKKALAQKKAKFYSIDALSISKNAGLGTHINVVMQVCFFKLSKVMDFDLAVKLLKDGMEKTYSKKGADVVKKNQDVIDHALSGLKEIEVDPSWAQLEDENVQAPDWPEFEKNIKYPLMHMQGEDMPVSTFEPHTVCGTGSTKYDKRGIATRIPVWNENKCVQCNTCVAMCSHAAIRPFLLTKEEVGDMKSKPSNAKKEFSYRIQVSPYDCTSCGVCSNVCPVGALTMVDINDELFESEGSNWNKLIDLPPRPLEKKNNIKEIGHVSPLYEFNAACAGCGESPYIKMLSQLFGERLVIGNASGCAAAVSLSYASIPYTKTSRGYGPCISNSLFEDNAEYGLGLAKAHQSHRVELKKVVEQVLEKKIGSEELREHLKTWNDNFADGDVSVDETEVICKLLAKENGDCSIDEIRQLQGALIKHSTWMLGGDGWAYDIGYGGLDHVLNLGMNINCLVLDTEVYSNTGGQKSKATPLSAVHKFEAGGKAFGKKDLGSILMSYGNIYVATVSIHYNPQHTLRILKEAEAFNGPSIVIGYAPCIEHGITRDWTQQAKLAVTSGYWPLYHFNPDLKKEGKNPFVLDSTVKDDVIDFISHENRFNRLERENPERAKMLHEQLKNFVDKKFAKLQEMSKK
ncbi:Pyruvate:ferredoxin (Flavodoxin) oxidoreductase [Entamoeba marina]